MAMDEVLRLEMIHEPEKGAKATVRKVRPIMNAQWWCVGEEHIEVAPPAHAVEQQKRHETPGAQHHLLLTVLVTTVAVITNAATQSGEQQATLFNDTLFDAFAAAWRADLSPIGSDFGPVMVAMHVQARHCQRRHEKLEIVVGQIATATNQFNIAKTLRCIQAIHKWHDFVADGEYAHAGIVARSSVCATGSPYALQG